MLKDIIEPFLEIAYEILDLVFELDEYNKNQRRNSNENYKKNNNITQDELNIADMNNDNSINSVDASIIIDMYKSNE